MQAEILADACIEVYQVRGRHLQKGSNIRQLPKASLLFVSAWNPVSVVMMNSAGETAWDHLQDDRLEEKLI